MRISPTPILAALLLATACTSEPSASVSPPHTSSSPPVIVAAKATSIGSSNSRPEVAIVRCVADPGDADDLLDKAHLSYAIGEFSMAAACAATAAEVVPQSVEAQHLRGASLSAQGFHEEAQLAFVLALALDPEDPETLAGAADFYVNALPSNRQQNARIGLEYAKRGTARAASRGQQDDSLLGRLLLLEAQALNDIGATDLALPRIEEALALEPGLADGPHELALSHFKLTHFAQSEQLFLQVLAEHPEDPYAHHYLALIYERLDQQVASARHFSEAMRFKPAAFPPPVLISRDDFAAEVDAAVLELPPELAALLSEARLQLADVPALADLRASSPPFSPGILGLFRGPSLRGPPQSSIVLYQKNLQRSAKTREQLNRQVRRTLRHEVGHLQGLTEVELHQQGLE